MLDIKFLYGTEHPTLAILYQARPYGATGYHRVAWLTCVALAWTSQDTKEARHIKTYVVSVRDKDIIDGPWQQTNLDIGASLVIPIPAPAGGVVVVGEQSVVFLDGAPG